MRVLVVVSFACALFRRRGLCFCQFCVFLALSGGRSSI